MTHDATAGLRRWREGRGKASKPAPSRTRTSKLVAATLLTTMLLGVAVTMVGIVLKFIFPDAPSPYFVPFWIAEYQKPQIPPIPWVEADREALRDEHLFPKVDSDEEATRNPSLEVMRTRLDNLKNRKSGDAVVVYLAAYATVDGEGKIQILATDSDPFAPKTLLPLSTVVARLKQCLAEKKLLVLDIMRTTPDPFDLNATADGVADLVRKELQSESDPNQPNDPHLLVIGSCAPGQVALGAEALGRSVFGHYFRLGLTDTEADLNHDRAVSVRELAGYLTRNVDLWAQHYRGIHQRPYLIGSGRDFPLVALTQRKSTWPWKKTSSQAKPKTSDQASNTTVDKDKANDQGAGKEMDKDKIPDKAAAKNKAAEKGTAGASESEGVSYPQWLADGWAVRENWWKANDFLAAPRIFRRLEAILLRAEQRWRGGGNPDRIQSELKDERHKLEAAMDQARNISRPPSFRSVGQAKDLGWQPDGELVDALRKVLRSRREPQPALVPPQQIDASLRKAILDKLKGKTSLDLAGAIVDAAGDEQFDVKTLEFLDSLIDDGGLPLDVVELRFLKQLARRAKAAPAEWSDTTARSAWDVVIMAETANSQPSSLAWVRDQLQQADADRHVAQMLMLPQAAGFVSWPRITAAWDQAYKAYATVQNIQGKIRRAQIALGRSLAMLRFYIPYLEATGRADLESQWLETAKTTHTLEQLLEKPLQAPSAEQLEQLDIRLNDLTQQLDRLLSDLDRPFRSSEILGLVKRCQLESERPDPALALMIDGILATPFPSSQERQQLWSALRMLDRRLAGLPMREAETVSDSGTDASRSDALQGRSGRRARRLAALMNLVGEERTAKRLDTHVELIREAVGLKSATGADLTWDMTDAVKVWSALGRYTQFVRAKFDELLKQQDRMDSSDRLGWIAPVFMLDWQANPTRLGRERDAWAAWSWLAEHYRHEGHDLPDLDDSRRFNQMAALEFSRTDELPQETFIELGMTAPTGLSLSAERPTAEFTLKVLLRAPEMADIQKVALAVLKPDDPRLRVTVTEPRSAELELTPQRPGSATVRVEWIEEDQVRPVRLPAGFIIQASLANRLTYHLLVPINIVAEGLRPRLVLSSDPALPIEVPFDLLRLRPIPGHQPFYVFVRNPAPTPRDVIVELTGKSIVAGGGVRPLKVGAKLKVDAHSTTAVPSFGATPPKPTDPLPELNGPLLIRLREAKATDDEELDRHQIQADIASPLDYLEVTQAQFVPARGAGEKNRLTVALSALRQMAGPPCPVELVLPRDMSLFPALLEPPQGTLSGTLEPGGTLTLYAEGLVLNPAAPQEGLFYLNVDGVERALWFKTNFARAGGAKGARGPNAAGPLPGRHQSGPACQAARPVRGGQRSGRRQTGLPFGPAGEWAVRRQHPLLERPGQELASGLRPSGPGGRPALRSRREGLEQRI